MKMPRYSLATLFVWITLAAVCCGIGTQVIIVQDLPRDKRIACFIFQCGFRNHYRDGRGWELGIWVRLGDDNEYGLAVEWGGQDD